MKDLPLKIGLELSSDVIEVIANRAAQIVETKNTEKQNSVTPKAYSVKEVAKLIPSLSESTIRKYCKDGIIEASKNGKSYLVSQDSINKYLTKNE